mgnify:CR=1 FL=1
MGSDKVDFQIDPLSKAIGVVDGYVIGSKNLINWLKVRGSPFLFSMHLTPSATTCTESINIFMNDDPLVKNVNYLKKYLKSLIFNIENSETPITPCIISDET